VLTQTAAPRKGRIAELPGGEFIRAPAVAESGVDPDEQQSNVGADQVSDRRTPKELELAAANRG